MKKCTKCGNKKVVYHRAFNFEGTKVPIALCKFCCEILIKSLMDQVSYEGFKRALELFGNKIL